MAAPLQIRMDVWGDEIVNRTMLRMGDRTRDMRPPFRNIVKDHLEPTARRQFATQGGYGSGGWEPITPARRAEKARLGLDVRILHATHALRDSFLGGSDHVERITRDSLRWGSRVPYGKFHRKTRPPIQLPAVVRVAIVKDIQRYIVEADRS